MKVELVSFCKNHTAPWDGIIVLAFDEGHAPANYVTNGACYWRFTESRMNKLEILDTLEHPKELFNRIAAKAMANPCSDFYAAVLAELKKTFPENKLEEPATIVSSIRLDI